MTANTLKKYTIMPVIVLCNAASVGVAGVGDLNNDCAVTLADARLFVQCINGPIGGGIRPACDAANADYDTKIDLYDFRVFQSRFGMTEEAIDNDMDGYTPTGACGSSAFDCDDANPTVFPGAFENPGNGIDDDCDGIDPAPAHVFLVSPFPDPCDGSTVACKSAFIEPFLTVSKQDAGVVSARASAEGSDLFLLSWTPNGSDSELSISLQGQAAEPILTSAFLPSLDAANITALMIAGLNAGVGTESVRLLPNASNEAGCDYLHDEERAPGLDCSDLGICCDIHDFCIQNVAGVRFRIRVRSAVPPVWRSLSDGQTV